MPISLEEKISQEKSSKSAKNIHLSKKNGCPFLICPQNDREPKPSWSPTRYCSLEGPILCKLSLQSICNFLLHSDSIWRVKHSGTPNNPSPFQPKSEESTFRRLPLWGSTSSATTKSSQNIIVITCLCTFLTTMSNWLRPRKYKTIFQS